jgi:allantoinase
MDIGGKRPIWIPYSYEIKDSLQVNNRNRTIDEFEKMIRRQFDTLYTEGAQSGRVMAICQHPYLIGVLHRISGLDSALGYIRSRRARRSCGTGCSRAQPADCWSRP